MARALAVSFSQYGQLHYLAAGSGNYAHGDKVLYPTAEGGTEVAEVVWSGESELPTSVPVCAGLASAEDLKRTEEHQRIRARSAQVFRTLVKQHHLEMKLLAVDYISTPPAYNKLTVFYYQAPNRVDFRALLTDLNRSLRSRIDLRQVGARDATRLTGGVGSCGRPLCCASHLTTVDPVSLRLAKDQDLAMNPAQNCGLCGHPKCCLRYEQSMYEEFHRQAPRKGVRVTTPEGEGVVSGYKVPLEAVVVRSDDGKHHVCPVEDACVVSRLSRKRP